MKSYRKDYQQKNRLIKELLAEIPEAMEGFVKQEQINATNGVLPAKVRELIALAIAISVQSKSCTTMHIKKALDAGATKKEIIETIGVAVLHGGNAVVMAGAEAYQALKEFARDPSPALLYG